MKEYSEAILDKYRGCLLGGAVGDALGYAVEFLSENAIRARYGARGITEYELTRGVAEISDDTQMTLFTANGLLLALTENAPASACADYIARCYAEWYRTQGERYPLALENQHSWIVNIPALFSPRAPGGTCLSALSAYLRGEKGSIESPINQSKGCGGVMRVAPVGLYFGEEVSIEDADRAAASAAALTHGHPLGYLPAAGLAHIVRLLSCGKEITLSHAVNDMIDTVSRLFADTPYVEDFASLMQRAVALAATDVAELDAIHALGEGWVGEEALAIAVYCALKHQSDFAAAIVSAVNHKGDSDSTGAITGNILGAYLGLSAIPARYLERLELKDVILTLADDLCLKNTADPLWRSKYVLKTYTPA